MPQYCGGPHQDWSIEEVELDGPRAGEVLVAWQATGLCHSDHHPRAGEAPAMMPTVGGARRRRHRRGGRARG